MCGIAGIVDIDGRADEELVRRMTCVLAHRGPDGEGFRASADGSACFGHRRLAIIDLVAGDQPMANEDGSIWVTCNGEIYNYVEVRKDLERLGHRFDTHSDTETIVHAYEEDGPRCVERFRGMFAFAVHDERRRATLLVTDRLGKKPIYYEVRGGRLRFGSELKSLTVGADDLSLDRMSTGLYLALGYIPPPYTAYSSIQKMGPAQRLWFDEHGLKIDTYWDLDFSPGPVVDESQAVEELESLLREAVRLRLRADVPVGVLLSGGLDSSLVAALAASEVSGSLRTFCVAFSDRAYDESPFAAQVASHIGSDHRILTLGPGAKYQEVLEEVVVALDEPFAVASVVPAALISREISQHCKVVLSGDGGDEGFAGYNYYWNDRWVDSLRTPFTQGLGRACLSVWPISRGRGPLRRLALNDIDYVLDSEGNTDALLRDGAVASRREVMALLTSEYAPPPGSGAWDRMAQLQYVDTRRTYLPGHILVKTDRASMMSGVEVRSPLLDVPLLERLATIPSSMKVKRGVSKALLRRVAAPWLPAEIVSRRKQGFNLPIASWFSGVMAPYVRDRLLDPAGLGDLFERAQIEALLVRNEQGVADYHLLYRLVVLSIWLSEGSLAAPVG